MALLLRSITEVALDSRGSVIEKCEADNLHEVADEAHHREAKRTWTLKDSFQNGNFLASTKRVAMFNEETKNTVATSS